MEGRANSVESLWLLIKAAIAWLGLWLRAGKKFHVEDEHVLMAFSILIKVPHKK